MIVIFFRVIIIAVGREMIADPDFVGRVLGLKSGNIRPCLACSEGCLRNVKQGNAGKSTNFEKNIPKRYAGLY